MRRTICDFGPRKNKDSVAHFHCLHDFSDPISAGEATNLLGENVTYYPTRTLTLFHSHTWTTQTRSRTLAICIYLQFPSTLQDILLRLAAQDERTKGKAGWKLVTESINTRRDERHKSGREREGESEREMYTPKWVLLFPRVDMRGARHSLLSWHGVFASVLGYGVIDIVWAAGARDKSRVILLWMKNYVTKLRSPTFIHEGSWAWNI